MLTVGRGGRGAHDGPLKMTLQQSLIVRMTKMGGNRGSFRKNETARRWDPFDHYKDVMVAQDYDRDRFSSVPGKVFDTLEKRCILKAFAELSAGATILDAPCGTGRLAEVLLDAGYRVIGVDISSAMLEVASRKLERFGDRFQAKLGDLQELAIDEGCFDAVLCARFLMHVPLERQIALLSAVARLSSRIVVFNQSLNTPYQRFRRRIKRVLRHQRPVAYPVTHHQMLGLILASGLRLEREFRILAMLSEAVVVKCVRDQ